MTNKEKIIAGFKKVKNLGFVESNRSHNTGIGKTFEDYLGVVENNDRLPDFEGYEVKTKRETSNSFSTLFTKSPSHPQGVNSYLRDTYGSSYPENPRMKKLHTSIFAHQGNTFNGKYSFRLINDKENRKVKISISSLVDGSLIDDSVYYTYDDLEYALKNKLKNLFFVFATCKHDEESGKELFHFSSAEIYETPSLENFLTLLDEGKIMYDIRIGSYKSGRNIGKPHDHGSGFRIKPIDLVRLYSSKEVVE